MPIASTHPAPSQFAGIELQLEVLEAVGIGAADAMRVSIVPGNYVSGSTLDEQVERPRICHRRGSRPCGAPAQG